MREFDRMTAGEKYSSFDAELLAMRKRAHALCRQYNLLGEDDPQRREILAELLPNAREPVLQGEIFIDYGVNLHIGPDFYANVRFLANDNAPIFIGESVMMGPNVSIYTAVHPMRFLDRRSRPDGQGGVKNEEWAKTVVIGDGCWIGGSVTILPGVSLGKRCVIGAGSVVAANIPDDCFAAGNPCRVIRPIDQD